MSDAATGETQLNTSPPETVLLGTSPLGTSPLDTSSLDTQPWPDVSVVIPARDCVAELPGCLDAVRAQTYRGSLEVIVAVAASSPDTARCAAASASSWPSRIPLRIVPNPASTTSAGLNLAISAASGEIIVRVDAQAKLPADYIAQAVATMRRTGAANVGGIQRPVGDCPMSRVIAAALSSPFGAGTAAFRRGRCEGPVDTVYLGVFDADALKHVGRFDESLERNQDYELNWRLREQGHCVWLDPSLAVDYKPRSSWAELARQYYDYGVWKRVVISIHPRSTQPRQLAAPVLVVGLALSAFELVRGRLRGGILPSAYVAASLLAAARLRSRLPSFADRVRAAARVCGYARGVGRWHVV